MEFEQDILNCLKVLKQGGTILYPTDTIWGIGCDATNAQAVEKIYQLKRRSDEKKMIILMADEKQVLKYVSQVDLAVFDYLRKLTTPTTVIYNGAIGLSDNVVAKDKSIAIRICKDIFCKYLIERFQKPIVSTSANISHYPSPKKFSEVKNEIRNAVDYVVQYRQDDTKVSSPSSVIKWEKGRAIILRS